MANLVVAGICNLKCPYCFAPPEVVRPPAGKEKGPRPAFLSLQAFEERLDFLDRSGIEEVRLIGGEPTLHPQFPELIRQARLRKKRIMVFTNGLMNEDALSCLEAVTPAECTVLVNMNASRFPHDPQPEEAARRSETLRRLGQRALPGFNLYQTEARFDDLLAVIQETNCQRAIRLGLAQPLLSGQNEYLHPKQYPILGKKIVQFAREAGQAGVRLEFDCGFVRCMFSDSDLDHLRQAKAEVGWHCSPVLDIQMDGKAIHCFPVGEKIGAPVEDDSSAQELIDKMAAQARLYQAAGIYKECSSCLYKRAGECTGGCLANTIRRFQHMPDRWSFPERQPQP